MDGGRALGAAAGVVGVLVVVLALVGQPTYALAPLAVVGAGLGVRSLGRHRRDPEGSWAPVRGGHAPSSPAPALIPGTRPATGPTRGSVARTLSVVEARMLALNPWFTAGIGFWLILLLLFGGVYVDDSEWSWWEFAALLPAFAHPLIGCSVVAVHRGVTRARRDQADELFDACPGTRADRTRAFLLTVWVPLVASWLFCAALMTSVAARNPRAYGPLGGRVAVEVLIVGVLAVGGTMLGVALGRWAPWLLAPIIAVVAVAGLSVAIAGLGSSSIEPQRAMVSWLYGGPYDALFNDPPVWERLAWLGGLSAVVGALALLHDERSARARVALAIGAIVALVAAGSLLRPLPDSEAERVADLIGDPAAHQTCTEVGPDIEVCPYDDYADFAAPVVDELRPVAAALPDGWTDRPVVFRQRFDAPLQDLPASVRDRLPPAGRAPNAEPADLVPGSLFLGFSSHPSSAEAARFRLAAHAVGLPSDPRYPGTSVSGQARGAVALWLATRGMTRAEVDATLDIEPSEPVDGRPLVVEVWPGTCHGEEQSVVWSTQDLAATRAIVSVPEDEVAATVAEDWNRWTDPETGTDELLEALGLHGLDEYDRIEPRDAGNCG